MTVDKPNLENNAAAARPQTTPSSDQPQAPRGFTSRNGVYVPAIKRKIAEWSKILKMRVTLREGSPWQSVEDA
jgi:hypothetical protein